MLLFLVDYCGLSVFSEALTFLCMMVVEERARLTRPNMELVRYIPNFRTFHVREHGLHSIAQ
jgi:hypothetical protein